MATIADKNIGKAEQTPQEADLQQEEKELSESEIDAVTGGLYFGKRLI